jgi:hypothetical protein
MRRRFIPVWLEFLLLICLLIGSQNLAMLARFQTEQIEAQFSVFQLGGLGYGLVAFAGGIFTVSLWNLMPFRLKPNPLLWSGIASVLNLVGWGLFFMWLLFTTNWGSAFMG